MSQKIGRPKLDTSLEIIVKTRIDAETHKALLKYCEENKTTVAEVLRKGIKEMLAKE